MASEAKPVQAEVEEPVSSADRAEAAASRGQPEPYESLGPDDDLSGAGFC